MIIFKHTFFVLLISSIFISCSKDSNSAEVVLASDYYPLKTGSWFVYDVDSISYNDFTTPVTIDTLTYQVKEAYTDTFYDQAGNLNYELKRYKRFGNDSVDVNTVPWEIADVWFVTVNNGSIERVEENIRYTSLSNPIVNGKSWDGNAFNFRDVWDFTYLNFGAAYESFSNTIQINQKQEDVVIEFKDFAEIYAKDIGLVFRKRIDVESQYLSDLSVPVLDRAEKGSQYFQRLKDYFIPQ